MKKTILITGATDGIGLETAKKLVGMGHDVLLHGRNPAKLEAVQATLIAIAGAGIIECYVADLSHMDAVDALANAVIQKHPKLDVLINNAGIFKTDTPTTRDGLDVRFVVNTLAPYRLTQHLKELIGPAGRVINLSSAAQASVNIDALTGLLKLDAMEAYAQSKLALTMCSMELSKEPGSPVMIAVNPGSMLGSKMVKEAFGVSGGDLGIGADILCRASLDESFTNRSGQYFDNDSGQFASPHVDATNPIKTAQIMQTIDAVLSQLSH